MTAAMPGLPQVETSLSRPQEVEVSTSVLYMSMSLDGYIAGPNDEPDNPGGDGFTRLHEWFATPGRGVLPAVRAGRTK
jgi:hypothetical protein